MKKCFLCWILLLGYFFSTSQNKPADWFLVEGIEQEKLTEGDKQLLDSLLTLYHAATNDTVRIAYLNQMVENLSDDNIWSKYNALIFKFSENKPEKVYVKYFAAALNNMGYLADIKGNTSLAINYYNRALQLREKNGDKRGIAESLHNIGSMYMDRKNYTSALSYFLKALEVEKKIHENTLLPNTLNKLSDIYLQQHKHREALEYLNQSLKLAEQSKDKGLIAGAYTRMGDIYSNSLDDKRVINCYTIAIKNAAEISDKSRLSLAYKGFSKFYYSRNNYVLAEKYGMLMHHLGKELGSPKVIMNASELLYGIYKKQGKVQNALDMHELFIQMRDSINNEEQAKAFADIEFGVKEAQLNAEHEKQAGIALAESKRQKTILWSVCGILCLVMVLVVFVLRSYNQKKKANILISKQKAEVEQQQREIIDSINYAKRIQQAVFKEEEHVSKHLPPHFILFKPKDIVSGDFYWAFEKGDHLYFAAADCTGHGVPGAFLTMLGISFLNEINAKEEILTPSQILNQLRDKVVKELGRQGQTKDGMDISLSRLNLKTKEFMWAGAYNPLWFIQHKKLHQIKADKQPIGYSEKPMPFTNHLVVLNSSDTFYLFTDGFADQFGGVKGKKFKYKQMEELLIANYHLSVDEQKEVYSKKFEEWKGDLEQVDDVIVIGIKLV